MKRIALVVMAMVVAGCQSKPIEQMSYTELNQLSGEIVKRCYAQGVKPRTHEMQICTQQEITREQANRAANAQRRIALGEGMAAMGQGFSNAGNTYRPPMHCTSQPTGTFVGQPTQIQTTCY